MKTKLALAAILLLTGCAGARSHVVMPTSKYPISMSNGMFGPNHEMLRPDQMEKVGELSIDRTAWGLLYSLVPLTPNLDISSEINQVLANNHADGVVRFRTNVRPCGLDYAFVLTFIPFWPGCANIEIHGDMIRYKQQPVDAQTQQQQAQR